jgi:hypothetical protein
MIRRLRALFRRRPYDDLLIVCFPKSGSTLLSKLLQAATGLPEAYLAELGAQHEQNLARRKLRRHVHRSVVQQHFKATTTNLELLEQFGIRPIVQTRSLFDVVVSLHDHYERDAHSLPCGVISTAYRRMNFAQRIDFLICAHLPWYFNFYMSWQEAAARTEVFPITYEQLTGDPVGRVSAILRFYRLSVAEGRIQDAVRQAGAAETRRNVGVAGRGMTLLLARHREAIRRQAATLGLDVDEHGSLAPALGDEAPRRRIASQIAA